MNRLHTAALVAVIALALVRIVSGYSEVSQTIDEAVHVAAGVEWLEQHSYRLHPENPPLARVAVGLLPYWHGAHSVTEYDDANQVLGRGATYRTRLWLARVGTLPAFVLLVAMVYLWAKRLFDFATALTAAVLLTTLPALLAHAGLATTDVAATAGTLCGVLAFAYWLERPSYPRAALLGCALGLAALIKFSAPLFVAATGVAIAAMRLALAAKSTTGESGRDASSRSRIPLHMCVALASAAAIVWSGYGGSLGLVAPGSAPSADSAAGSANSAAVAVDADIGMGERQTRASLDALTPEGGFVVEASRQLLAARLPAPEFFLGLVQVTLHGLEGHSAYLLGEVSRSGWWYFFPVAIAVKTPLPFLALSLVGALFLLSDLRRQPRWLALVPVVAPIAILLSVLPSSLNIGLRHVLAVFPFLAVCGGVAVSRLWGSGRYRTGARFAAATLLLWQLGASLAAHPDYLAYFNAAVRHPEDILIDSDLDWGQDLYRLRREFESRGIEKASLALFTTADLANLGLDRFHQLSPGERRKGWVAASLFSIRRQPGYAWLEGYDPVALVGRSIRLYRIDPAMRAAQPDTR